MHRSLKAALLSGLVFPGVGQLFLGLRLRALLFLLPAAAGTAAFLAQVWRLASTIADEIVAGRIGLDVLAISARIDAELAASPASLNWAAAVMIVSWLASTADAWYAGRRLAEPA